MEVQLTTDQNAFARRAVESGRMCSEEEAVKEALSLWEDRRRRLEFLATLERSRSSLARGEGRVIITQESMRELAAQVKERGRARLIAQLADTR